jgi:uncharacterized protein YceK
MRLFVVIVVTFALAGCGNMHRHIANVTGYSQTCIDGVKYIQFPSGVSVKYTREGKVETC